MKIDWNTIQSSIKQLIDEYKFDPQQVLDIVKLGIKSAFKKDYLTPDKKYALHVTIWHDGSITIYRQLNVVEEVNDSNKEISLEDAKKYKSNCKVWEIIYIDITPDPLEFSRISVQAAAQTIKQNTRKIERERFYEKFQNKQWEILKGKVIKVINENVVLDIEWATVILPPEWQIPNRIYNIWEEIFVLLRQISRWQWWIVLDITQSTTDFIYTILKEIVPEVKNWDVQIIKIVRSAGKKSKVLVKSDDERIDPVWVFMWRGWDRIHTILSILEWEKVEFIQNFEEPENLIKESLKPAQIKKVVVDWNVAKVDVDQEQKAIAIWKQAINIKLASQLTWYKIQINE